MVVINPRSVHVAVRKVLETFASISEKNVLVELCITQQQHNQIKRSTLNFESTNNSKVILPLKAALKVGTCWMSCWIIQHSQSNIWNQTQSKVSVELNPWIEIDWVQQLNKSILNFVPVLCWNQSNLMV